MSHRLPILVIRLDPLCQSQLELLMADHDLILRPYDMEKLIEEVFSPPPSIIFCGPAPEGVSLIEAAQGLRMSYQNTPIFYLTSIRAGFDRKIFIKNGFTDAFLLPAEVSLFSQVVREEISKQSQGKVRTFRSVKLLDVTPGTELPFDSFVYLPANKKHIKVSEKGDTLDVERVNRLKKHQISNVEITSDQLQDFYQFSAQQLKKLGSNQAISETERKERMQTANANSCSRPHQWNV
jgi:hypothetical protein